MPNVKWTIVQHSGYAYGEKQGFKAGLEEAAVSRKDVMTRIEREGGLLFDDYKTARDYATAEMFPDDHEGIYPKAPGTFSKFSLDGQRLYLPAKGI